MNEKKEPYEAPTLEIVYFSAEDIITTSGENDTPFESCECDCCDWEDDC